MQTFTPSSTSSVVAGVGFWALVWSIAMKIDRATFFFGMQTHIWKRISGFVRKEKVLSLSITELINYGIHGISNPLSVMFAMGGTLFNVFMIFLAIPFLGIFSKKTTLNTSNVVSLKRA